MTANEGLPEYLPILRDEDDPLFSEKEFRFADSRSSGLVLESGARWLASRRSYKFLAISRGH